MGTMGESAGALTSELPLANGRGNWTILTFGVNRRFHPGTGARIRLAHDPQRPRRRRKQLCKLRSVEKADLPAHSVGEPNSTVQIDLDGPLARGALEEPPHVDTRHGETPRERSDRETHRRSRRKIVVSGASAEPVGYRSRPLEHLAAVDLQASGPSQSV